MNFDFSAAEGLGSVLERVIAIINIIFDMLENLCDAMNTFYEMLKEFNSQINLMVYDPAAGSGLPIIEAIGVVRYLVGDTVFYTIYLVILFGCLSTIYRLIVLAIEAKDAIVEQVKGGASGSGLIASIISKFS